jgi:hypothetical protein
LTFVIPSGSWNQGEPGRPSGPVASVVLVKLGLLVSLYLGGIIS